jgi:hypothetical protein
MKLNLLDIKQRKETKMIKLMYLDPILLYNLYL